MQLGAIGKITVYLIFISIVTLMGACARDDGSTPTAASVPGEDTMTIVRPAVGASQLPAPPPIDLEVPALIETASFGLG